MRLDVDFGVSHDRNPPELTKLAIEAAQSVPRVLAEPTPVEVEMKR